MKEVGIGLYKPEMPTGENAPASLHNIGASPMWHVMTLRRRGGNEAFRNRKHGPLVTPETSATPADEDCGDAKVP